MRKVTIITVLLLLSLLATIGTAVASESKTAFRAGLSGEAAGSGSDAHGNAVFVFNDDGSKMKFKLVVNGLDDVTMAHIHVASTPGGDGPPVVWLYPDGPPPSLIEGTFNGLLGSGTVSGESLADVRSAIEEGRAYVNVHTLAFPGGEIRGTIR